MKKIVLLAVLAMVTVCALAQTKKTAQKVTVNQKTNAQKVVVFAPYNKGTIIVKPQNGCVGCKKVVKKKPVKAAPTESQASINARLANEARIRMEMEYARLRDSINYANWLNTENQNQNQPVVQTWKDEHYEHYKNANCFQGDGQYHIHLSQSGWKRIGPGGRAAMVVVSAAVVTTAILFIRNCIIQGCWKPDAASPAPSVTTPPSPAGGPANVETIL